MFLLSVFAIVGCCDKPTISYREQSITINVGDVYTVNDDDITVVGEDKKYSLSILDESVAYIEDNTIIPLKEGKTYLRIAIDKKCYVDVEVVITQIIYATSARVEKNEIQINILQSNIATNVIEVNENCNEVPVVTYDAELIDFDYVTGKITAIKTGRTSVIVLYRNCNVSFVVNIVDIVYTSQIEVDDCSVFCGGCGVFEFSKFPSLANTYEFSSQSELLIVNSDGSYEALAEGVAEVSVTFVMDSTGASNTKTFVVTIIPTISELNISVVGTDGSLCNYYLISSEYLMVIDNVYNVTEEDVILSGECEVVDVQVNNSTVNVIFKFTDKGNVNIDVCLKMADNLTIDKSSVWSVNGYEDIELIAHWLYYRIDPTEDGSYSLYINGPEGMFADYLIFNVQLDSYDMVEDFYIYDVSSGVRIDIGNEFRPTQTGCYNLEIVINDNVVKAVTINVYEYE